MATQAFPYLVMTDGTLTATFADGSGGLTSYAPINGTWAPAIAGLRKSTLGGRGPYNDVVETWDLNIRGADAATALANLETLTRLLDQAERWWRMGQNIFSPVLLKYTPQGSTLFTTANPAECLVLGRAGGDETAGVSLPVIFNDVGMYYEIRGVRLKFIRAGQWLNPTAETVSSGASNNPSLLNPSLATNQPISSPTKIQVAWSSTFWGTSSLTPVVLYGDSGYLLLLEAESGSLGANVTSVADAANKARGGNVARYTPVNTNLNLIIGLDLGSAGMSSSARRFAVYAAVRNNSGSTTWSLQVALQSGAIFPSAPLVPIDVSTTNPRIVFLGTVASPIGLGQLLISAQASAASGTLDIDYVAVVAVDTERSGALAVFRSGVGGLSPLVIDPQPLTNIAPAVTIGTQPMRYNGDAMIQSAGLGVFVVMLQTTNNYWVMTDSGGTVLTNTLTLTRNNAYLSPR